MRRGKISGAPWSDKAKCPNCGEQLVTRHRRKDGRKFIGCSGFPKCHYLRAYTSKSWDWKDEDRNYFAEWRKNERIKAKQLKKAGDVHCPRCNVGILGIQSVNDHHWVGCNQAACDYKEDYGQEESTS